MKVPRLNRFLPNVRAEIEERLLAGDFTSYRALAAELRRRGWYIGKSALHAHRQRLVALAKVPNNKRIDR
jgi:hypothetical protein